MAFDSGLHRLGFKVERFAKIYTSKMGVDKMKMTTRRKPANHSFDACNYERRQGEVHQDDGDSQHHGLREAVDRQASHDAIHADLDQCGRHVAGHDRHAMSLAQKAQEYRVEYLCRDPINDTAANDDVRV